MHEVTNSQIKLGLTLSPLKWNHTTKSDTSDLKKLNSWLKLELNTVLSAEEMLSKC